MKVSVQLVTFNSSADICPCLDSLAAQTAKDFRVRILDNASSDNTLELLQGRDVDLITSDTNTGFAAAHNRLARAYPAPYILFLNPDTVLEGSFIENLTAALGAEDKAGSATGKLLRMDGETIDSTGIVMTRNQRHLDRGAGEIDSGQYDRLENIFGPSGAAALYRYGCLEDVAIDGEFFDEDFFAYREDADLAWRCQLMGWDSLYVPTAVARHRRHVTPERRFEFSQAINRHSVKNRFLLRINNMTAGLYFRDFWPITVRDFAVIGYVILQERSSFPGLLFVLGNLPRLWRKRRIVQKRVRRDQVQLEAWFR